MMGLLRCRRAAASSPWPGRCGRGWCIGWLLSADRLFYNWADWCATSDSGADLLWRVKDDLRLPYLELLPDGSYRSVLVKTAQPGSGRDALIEAARRGEDLDPALARHVRVVEYEADGPDGGGEMIALITTIADHRAAPAAALAGTYHHRWDHETANGRSSRPSCAARGGSCGPAARNSSSRRSGGIS